MWAGIAVVGSVRFSPLESLALQVARETVALGRDVGAQTPRERVEPVTFCRAFPVVTEWVGAEAVRSDGVVGMVRMMRERVVDRRLVDQRLTIDSLRRICRRRADADPSDDRDGRDRD
ncbi:hypothetical protein R1CP_39950 (plasmid) [Rhodococcus opacus]|uniref:Uncharacterized protein n=1 Tax=Rhodococcus opacus TaxID=37919 RepID=A0A1B1KIX6_RHOOP|nr:hypothetical protein R1CP_39950 [Rhodococcus opacus]